MLDKTDFFAAAFFPAENDRSLFLQISAWGNYPKFWAGMAFSFNRNWKKVKTAQGQSYWYSGANRLSISLESRQAFAASSRDAPLPPFAVLPYAEIPEGFDAFRSGSPLSLWLEDPTMLLSRILLNYGIPLNVPVQKIFTNIYYLQQNNSEEQYEALIRMQFENSIQARGLAALLSLAGTLDLDDPMGEIFFSNAPSVNGNNVDIKTPVLSGEALSLLMGMFLLL